MTARLSELDQASASIAKIDSLAADIKLFSYFSITLLFCSLAPTIWAQYEKAARSLRPSATNRNE